MEITNEILFNNNYPKIHNQKTARLLAVITGFTYELLKNRFPDFMLYDTLRDDGFYYKMDEGTSYILLLFEGDEGILFSTFRRDSDENFFKYNGLIGQFFIIKTKK